MKRCVFVTLLDVSHGSIETMMGRRLVDDHRARKTTRLVESQVWLRNHATRLVGSSSSKSTASSSPSSDSCELLESSLSESESADDAIGNTGSCLSRFSGLSFDIDSRYPRFLAIRDSMPNSVSRTVLWFSVLCDRSWLNCNRFGNIT